MKHIITFENDLIVEENALNQGWNRLPDYKIKRWEYQITKEKSVIFEGFEEYNHNVKRGTGLGNKFKGIILVYLWAKYQNKIKQVTINFLINKIESDAIDCVENYNKFLGWKDGVRSDNPHFCIT